MTLDCLNLLDTAADEQLDTLVRIAKTIFGVNTALISLIDRDRQWFKARIGLDITETPRNIAFCSHTILQRETLVVPNALNDPRFSQNPLVTSEPSIRLYAGHPIRVNGFPIGTLCLLHDEERELSESDRMLLADLATLAEGYVFQRIQNTHIKELYESLDSERYRAMTDPLTGVWNREGMNYFSALIGKKASSGNKQVGVLFCDLDMFKSVNERYGHAVGDEALVHAARQLKSTLRVDDVLVRYGGEEFVIMSLIKDIDELMVVADRVRRAVSDQPLSHQGVKIHITTSIGAAMAGEQEQLIAVFERANRLLLEAKSSGRDRVVLQKGSS